MHRQHQDSFAPYVHRDHPDLTALRVDMMPWRMDVLLQ
ncbi:hypothetical protein EV13_2033 [Prochlorococcus sp. MIT 0702]|nr:hypothetical protein EV13_2033 [Prochlorococcus sp. MIT 0702]KGG28192.1 hypothetical protein EV12_0942 [Prochlorococcus sp. MIT 0701]KGG37242.1 hypothetical protein EV14_0034 [Prochlorococcus sp. MIT 0703]